MNISIYKAVRQAKSINEYMEKMEKEFGLHLGSNKLNVDEIRESILNHFKYIYEKNNNNIDLKKIKLNEVDKVKLSEVNSYSDLEKIYNPYISGKSRKIKLEQMGLSLSMSIYDSEIKKYKKNDKYFNLHDYRTKVDVKTITETLKKKTDKYLTFTFNDSIYQSERNREFTEILRITTGIIIDPDLMRRGLCESSESYQGKLNSLNQMVNFVVFDNGNIRVSIKDKRLYEEFRKYFVGKELAKLGMIRSY